MATEPQRRPLEEALESELHRVQRAAARIWTIVGAILTVSSLAYAGAVAPLTGLTLTILSATYLGWYLWLWWRLSRGPTGRALEGLIVLGEVAMPWIGLMLLFATRGVEYALGSWVPPMLFCAQIVSNTIQLRPGRALANGLAGAVVFTALYFLVMREALPTALYDELLYSPRTQLTRALSLALGGVAGMLSVRAAKSLIVRAEIVSRERDLFGKYRLVRKLASGGMGTVHEAVYCPEGGFERRVAVKRIHPHLAEQARFVDAFRREAALSALLHHPNIVQVMDFGRVDGRYFLSMEFVDGEPLSEVAARVFASERGMEAGIVAHVGREILAGLDHAHRGARAADGSALRVVHRDMCPHNVLVSRAGHVKISDFGVARALEDGGSAVTQTFVGHVGYVAPEQAGGEHEIDERADLFPVGVMLWELLAGRPLFVGKSQAATINAVLRAEIPPLDGVDPGWSALIERALARDPEARFVSAAEMLEALEALAVDPDASRRLAALLEAGAADDATGTVTG